MKTHQQAVRDYLAKIVEVTGKDLTMIARLSGVSPSTLTRFANKTEVKHLLSLKTLSKVAAVTGVPVPVEVANGPDRHDNLLLEAGYQLSQLQDQQLSLLNRSWDALYDDERAALIATAKAFIANRRGKSA